jgi:DNA (cytosine-5)-methyltransferase 1
VLTGRSNIPKGTEKALATIRGRERLAKAELDEMQAQLASQPARQQLERFRSLLPKRKVWADLDQLVEQLDLKASEERTFRLLAGEDVLLATQATLRVAARVAGSESDKTNRLSDGRVDLARLIGAGPDAPLRAAALRLLGSTICKAPTTLCADCPLRKQCAGQNGEQTVQTLF